MWWNRDGEPWNLMVSIRCALRGLWLCLGRERNLRIHLCAGVYVLWAAARTGRLATQWALLLLAWGAVLTAELFNSALEALVDGITGEYRLFARDAKDMAAGAVLVASIFGVGVAAAAFWPLSSLLDLLRQLLLNPLRLGLLALSLVLALAFIFVPCRRAPKSHPDGG